MPNPQRPDELSEMLGTDNKPAQPRRPGDPPAPHQGKSVAEGGDVPLGEQSNAGPTPSETDKAPAVRSFRDAEAESMRTDRETPRYKETKLRTSEPEPEVTEGVEGTDPATHVRLVPKTERDPVNQSAVETEPSYLAMESPYPRMLSHDGVIYENTGIEDGYITYRQPDF